MGFTEKMLVSVIENIKKSLSVKYKDKEYDFKIPWARVTYRELILKYLDFDIDKIKTEPELVKLVKERNWLSGEKLVGYGQVLDALYKKHVRPNLDGPMFITDHPVEMKPLAKRKENDLTKAASFQLLVAGEEWINAYNELNDPRPKNRWLKEMELAKKGAEDYQVIDEDYIRALEYGMPPTAGWGLGIDRLTAFLTDQPNIKDVILFPTLRPELKKVTPIP
jgi:lysyl-tRNA synthetase class 2